ncbi:SecDF P1 head subdomain-containing protein [Nioella sp.]|uniref:SecDF P1 head subdomain-containing protein n=1 Tax=Nioella sp. TaxID=1912091 RepID=UPI003B51F7B7
MEPESLGFLSGFVSALSGLAGAPDAAPPPDPVVPQPGGAVIELRVSGEEYTITPEHILGVVSGLDDTMGWPQLELTFDDSAAALFAEITTTHQGQQMELVVCDQVLMAPVIQEPITGGQIVVTGSFTQDEISHYANQISGSIPCDSSVDTK